MVYLPTFTIKNQPNVAQDAIHGSDPLGKYIYIFTFQHTQTTLRILSL